MAQRSRVLPRTEFGNPILTRKAKRVSRKELSSEEFIALTRDLIRTMRAAKGVGLAAPQVGVSKSVAVLEIRETPERKGFKAQGPLVIVNPRVVSHIGTPVLKWEGCLSFCKAFGKVPRFPRVSVEYTTLEGETVTETVGGLWGHIFQHEIDHLEGIRFIDRMEDAKSLVTAEEYRKIKAKKA